jgi:hypothetical protein
MFSFFKRHRPQEQFYEAELTVRERALRAFSKIEGLDDIKEERSLPKEPTHCW